MKAIYYDIYKDLRDKIIEGVYPYQSYIPSELKLIDQYECTHNTLRKALVVLQMHGFVQPIRGKGVKLGVATTLLAEDADDPGETLGDRFARVLAPYGAELDAAFARVSDEAVLDDLGYSLGRALAALATVLDPGRIVFSGTLGDAWEVLGPSVRRALVDETYYRGDLPFALGTAENLSNNLSL